MKKINLKRKNFIAIVTLLMLLALPMEAFAELVVLDPFTGEEINESSAVTGNDSASDSLTISNTCSYNKTKKMFEYNKGEAYCTAFDGMVTNNAVYLEAGVIGALKVYRDGEEVDASEFENLNTAGSYVVRDSSSEVLSFTIVGDYSNKLTTLNLPSAFYISEATRDGAHVEHGDHTLSMKEDGKYEITYYFRSIDQRYTLNVIVDHTAPVLEFEGLNEKNVANGPVTIKSLEAGSSLSMTRDGKPTTASLELKKSGRYVVTYTDAAGNSSNYNFLINTYFNLSAIGALASVAIIIICLIVFFIYSRKHLRTR